MKIKATCRNCGWSGKVQISKRNWLGKRPAVTGVPCPKCGQHKLQRIIEKT